MAGNSQRFSGRRVPRGGPGAAAPARDHDVRRAFPDGIVWVPLGQLPALSTLQRVVARGLGDPGHFESVPEGKARLHGQLLDAYRQKCPQGWPSGPNDGYFFQHLRYHFVEAGRSDELVDLLRDLRWLEAKNERGLVFDLVQDYAVAVEELPLDHPQRRILKLLDEALRSDIHPGGLQQRDRYLSPDD